MLHAARRCAAYDRRRASLLLLRAHRRRSMDSDSSHGLNGHRCFESPSLPSGAHAATEADELARLHEWQMRTMHAARMAKASALAARRLSRETAGGRPCFNTFEEHACQLIRNLVNLFETAAVRAERAV